MIVNELEKFVFLQNPKCASTYVRTALLKIPGSEVTRTSQHGSIRDAAILVKEDITRYKVFGTVRNPLDFYPSLYSFTRITPKSHATRYFPATTFREYLKRVLYVNVVQTHLEQFKEFIGKDAPINYPYGWATYSNINWLTTTRNFGKLENNTFLPMFRVGDNFQSQISEFLGASMDIWPSNRINLTPNKVELNDTQRKLILERDRPTFEKWYPAEL